MNDSRVLDIKNLFFFYFGSLRVSDTDFGETEFLIDNFLKNTFNFLPPICRVTVMDSNYITGSVKSPDDSLFFPALDKLFKIRTAFFPTKQMYVCIPQI